MCVCVCIPPLECGGECQRLLRIALSQWAVEGVAVSLWGRVSLTMAGGMVVSSLAAPPTLFPL